MGAQRYGQISPLVSLELTGCWGGDAWWEKAGHEVHGLQELISLPLFP